MKTLFDLDIPHDESLRVRLIGGSFSGTAHWWINKDGKIKIFDEVYVYASPGVYRYEDAV